MGCTNLATNKNICDCAWNIPVTFNKLRLFNLNLIKRTQSLGKWQFQLKFFKKEYSQPGIYLMAIMPIRFFCGSLWCDNVMSQPVKDIHWAPSVNLILWYHLLRAGVVYRLLDLEVCYKARLATYKILSGAWNFSSPQLDRAGHLARMSSHEHPAAEPQLRFHSHTKRTASSTPSRRGFPKLSTRLYGKDCGTRNQETFVSVLVLQVPKPVCEGFRSETDAQHPLRVSFRETPLGDPFSR